MDWMLLVVAAFNGKVKFSCTNTSKMTRLGNRGQLKLHVPCGVQGQPMLVF